MRSLLAGLLIAGCAAEDGAPRGEPLPPPAPVSVTILAPQDGALIAGTSVHVTGEVAGTSETTVLINGVEVPASAGVF